MTLGLPDTSRGKSIPWLQLQLHQVGREENEDENHLTIGYSVSLTPSITLLVQWWSIYAWPVTSDSTERSCRYLFNILNLLSYFIRTCCVRSVSAVHSCLNMDTLDRQQLRAAAGFTNAEICAFLELLSVELDIQLHLSPLLHLIAAVTEINDMIWHEINYRICSFSSTASHLNTGRCVAAISSMVTTARYPYNQSSSIQAHFTLWSHVWKR